MPCQKCDSMRLATFSAKCSDMFNGDIADDADHDGYVPEDWGIGGGDYVEMTYCLHCGTIEGEWPLPETDYERGEQDED